MAATYTTGELRRLGANIDKLVPDSSIVEYVNLDWYPETSELKNGCVCITWKICLKQTESAVDPTAL